MSGETPAGGTYSFLTEETSVDAVLARLHNCKDERLVEVMSSVIRHLHAVVKEVEPTQQEWALAIDFLTKTGQKCDDKRQEWILMSDTLGVSMLVDAINHRRPSGATENTVLGPFHVEGAPVYALGGNISKDGKGTPCFVSGRVLDSDGNAIPGAKLDVWQSNADGFYDVQQPGIQPAMNLRGIFRADDEGRYWFRTQKPQFYPVPTDGPVGKLLMAMGRHPFRPAHLHYIVSAEGFETVTTHIFVRDDPYLHSDAVFGVKESLIRDFDRVDDPDRAAEIGLPNPFAEVAFDVVLARV